MQCDCHSNSPALSFFDVPDGAAGTREVLKHMREQVRRDKRSPALRHIAHSIVQAIPAKDFKGEIRAVFDFVRGAIRYGLDSHNMEVVQSAPVTLALGYGDCDDMCVLLATLLESIGHACAFCAVGFKDIGDYSHVLILVSAAAETAPVALDATEPYPAGWMPPGVSCMLIAPIEGGFAL
jgi:hypothetical protein